MLIHWHAKDPRIWQKYIRKEYTIQGSVLAAQTLNKNLKKNVNEKSNFAELTGMLPGASTGDPTHDKVMWKRPDKQGRSGLKGPHGPARAYPKTRICLSYYFVPFTNSSDINRRLSPTIILGENQLRAVANKSPGHERNLSIQPPSVGILACLTGLSRLLQLRMWLFTVSQL